MTQFDQHSGNPGGSGPPPGGFGSPGAPQGGFQNHGYGPGQGAPYQGIPQAYVQQKPSGAAPNFLFWMIINIVSAVVCQTWAIGIIGFVFALLAKNDWDVGNYMGADSKYKIAKIIGIISLCIGVLIVLVFAAFFIIPLIFVGVTAASTPPSY